MEANNGFPLTLDAGVILTTFQNSDGDHYGLFSTTGELRPRAGWIDGLYWSNPTRSAELVRQFADELLRRANAYDELLEALRSYADSDVDGMNAADELRWQKARELLDKLTA